MGSTLYGGIGFVTQNTSGENINMTALHCWNVTRMNILGAGMLGPRPVWD